MKAIDDKQTWDRLMDLLEPFHERAQRTAVHLTRSPEDGMDLFQETVLRAFEKLHTLRHPERFRAWFFAVLLSVHRSRGRRAFWKRFAPLHEALAAVDPRSRSAEEQVSGYRRVTRALAGLPAEQREAVALFELEDFSIAEIAEMQEVTLSCVKSRLARGRRALAETYRRKGWVSPERSAPGPLSSLAVVPAGGNSQGERHA